MSPDACAAESTSRAPGPRGGTAASRLTGLESALDRLHARARDVAPLHRLAIISRILLALAFIPTGMVKVLGERFTLISPDTPIGYFFEAMYQTGFYWNFLGWAQVAAGLLLLVPWTMTLGALVAFPLVLNIFLITVSLEFTGTPFVTGGMLLAATFLVCWDYDRFKTIVWPRRGNHGAARADGEGRSKFRIGRLELAGYVLGTVCGLGVFGATRSLSPGEGVVPLLLLGLVAAGMVAAAWVRDGLARRRSASSVPTDETSAAAPEMTSRS